jgi:hypothetical protein
MVYLKHDARMRVADWTTPKYKSARTSAFPPASLHITSLPLLPLSIHLTHSHHEADSPRGQSSHRGATRPSFCPKLDRELQGVEECGRDGGLE